MNLSSWQQMLHQSLPVDVAIKQKGGDWEVKIDRITFDKIIIVVNNKCCWFDTRYLYICIVYWFPVPHAHVLFELPNCVAMETWYNELIEIILYSNVDN